MKRNYPLYIVLALAVIIRLIFAFSWHEVWWDSGVYIGMGKHLYSSGESGLWEHIRPPFLPIMLGFLWKTGLSPILLGRLLEIIFMLGTVWLTYKLALHWFENKTALIAALIVALSPIFYYLSFHQYNEIPSTFFVLLAVWLSLKEKHFLAGITTGIAFLSKFAPGMFAGIIILYLAVNKKWKPAILTGAGFAIITSPYFLYSWIAYGNPFATFSAAQDAISKVLGCNVLHYQPWHQYFSWLVFSETKLHFLAIFGLFALYKKWKKQHLLFTLSILIPLIYFTQLNCRDYRYITLFLPFISILTALGVVWTYDQFKPKKEWIFAILVILLSAWMLNTTIKYYYENELQQPDTTAEEYLHYLSDKNIAGEIWTANPIVSAYTDKKLEKIYYPVYNENVLKGFTDHVAMHNDKIGAILLDNCGGGIICPPSEQNCQQKTEELISLLDKTFTRTFNKESGRCWYKIWLTSSS
jgi:4-amino-4-deoxy-L-arabinose transferase-like glycosyltransferase